jgi:hypothetical protein
MYPIWQIMEGLEELPTACRRILFQNFNLSLNFQTLLEPESFYVYKNLLLGQVVSQINPILTFICYLFNALKYGIYLNYI